MTVNELIKYLEQGREIEFTLYNESFFMSFLCEEELLIEKYYIWNNEKKCDIVIGSIDDLLLYKFNNGMTLKDNIEEFSFQYIL